jgi:hypothetical protein
LLDERHDYLESGSDSTGRGMSTPNWSEIEANRDRAEALPECDWTTETPETEAAVKASGSTFGIPLRETSRRLERQRDQLAALFKKGK